PPQALAADNTASLSANPSETPAIPVQGWATAPGTMTVGFLNAVSARRGDRNPPKITLTLPYNQSAAAQILAAQAPVIQIASANGKTQFISADAAFDIAKGTMTVQLLPGQIAGATQLKVFAAVDGSGIRAVSYGPRYWYTGQNAWSATAYPVNPSKRTVVMVHGIFSSVETAFPCEQTLLDAGGYAQGLGLDYNWTQPPQVEAPILANFINSLPVSTVDIEAHSYGTVVTLAALPLITKKLGHVVLLGGPLPLNGSPQADPGYLRDLVMLGVFLAYPSDVYHAYHSGMIASMATNSPEMQRIWNALKALSLPPFVQVAGGSPLPQEVQSDAVYVLYLFLYGGAMNDGIVEQQSATQRFPTTTEITFLNDDHIQLECQDPGIISWVGSHVHP
ncbi:MAG: hypothetical protein JOZ97_02475, partial [Candidatus Eremiobacteraeota bacterium]|nr:hypothetical protein [Candidatus Eremiobacteraeota bacterium]